MEIESILGLLAFAEHVQCGIEQMNNSMLWNKMVLLTQWLWLILLQVALGLSDKTLQSPDTLLTMALQGPGSSLLIVFQILLAMGGGNTQAQEISAAARTKWRPRWFVGKNGRRRK